MNHITVIASIIAIAVSLAASADKPAQCAAACKDAAKTTVAATALLSDGSTIKGEFLAPKITGSTAFIGKLALNPTIVKSITFSGTNNAAKVELENGDRFTMRVRDKRFTLRTVLGRLDIPRRTVRSLTLAKRSAAAKGDEGLVFYCTFDDEASVAAPAVGPSVKMELGKIVADKGKIGGALFVNPGVSGAVVVLPKGTLGPDGCIEFWANMASGKTEFSTGGDPNYFAMYREDGAPGGALGFASNDGAGNSGICGFFFGMRAYSNSGYTHMMPYSDVFKGEDYNGWHHYAFTWSRTSLSLYIDGKRVAHTTGHLNAGMLSRGDITLAIPLHRTMGKSFNNKSAFYMDELKIWNKAKTEFDR